MHGHFQVLAADERFGSLGIGLYRNPGVDVSFEIIVGVDEESLDVVAELAEFASERGLESRFNDSGEVALYEPGSLPA
jgi:hypothetical protein